MQTKKKVSVSDVLVSKHHEKIAVLTAYDYSTATMCDKAGTDILVVGDGARMVVLGHASTVRIEMNEMLIFAGAVARGTIRAMGVGDMPFGSSQQGQSTAIENAVALIKAGCDAVKLEGGEE